LILISIFIFLFVYLGNQHGIFEKIENSLKFQKEHDKRISLSVETGKLYVYSNPSGADVYLGNEKKGQTPLKITYINPGDYEISIRKKFYVEIKRQVLIENKKSKVFFFES